MIYCIFVNSWWHFTSETPRTKYSYPTQAAEAAHVLRELSSAALPRTVEARIENPHLEKFDDYSMNAIVDLKHDVVKNLARLC